MAKKSKNNQKNLKNQKKQSKSTKIDKNIKKNNKNISFETMTDIQDRKNYIESNTNSIEFPKEKIFRYTLNAIFILIILPISIYFYANMKIDLMKEKSGYSEKEDIGMFWSEVAFQYRYAEMLSNKDEKERNKAWDTFSNDIKLQYPDGIDSWKEHTIFMEIVHAFIYRNFVSEKVPFHIFIMWFVVIFSSLMAYIIYFGINYLWKNPIVALIGAFAWMAVPVSFGRQVSSIYLKEDFSLVFIILFVVLFVVSLRNKNIAIPILGAISLFIALVSWHFSQFIFLLLGACILAVYVINKDWKKHYTRNIIIYTASGFIAGLIPVLWTRGFIISFPMLIFYSILITAITKPYWNKVLKNVWFFRALIPIVIAGLFILVNLIFNSHLTEYSHVFELFWYKIINLGIPPENPAELPFGARIFWAGDFNGYNFDDFYQYYLSMGIIVLLVFISSVFLLITKNLKIEGQLLTFFFLSTLILTFIVSRLSIFLAIASAIGVVFVIIGAVKLIKLIFHFTKYNNENLGDFTKFITNNIVISKRIIIIVICVLIGICETVNATKFKYITPKNKQAKIETKLEMFEWIKNNTNEDDAFICGISDGPMVLLYTDRPVVLNSQFENSLIRKRTQEFNTALYGKEDDLYNFAKKYKAKYVMVRTNMILTTKRGNPRYYACKTGGLSLDTAAVMIQFMPEKMKNFTPVFDNDDYRIVRVLYEGDNRNNFYWDKSFSSLYDISLFEVRNNMLVNTDEKLKIIADTNKILEETEKIFQQISEISMLNKKNPNPNYQKDINRLMMQGKTKLDEALKKNPRELVVYHDYGVFYAQSGDLEKALEFFKKGLEIAPGDDELQVVTFDTLQRLSRFKENIELGEKILKKEHNEPIALYMTSYAHLYFKNFEKAFEYANRSIDLISKYKIKQPKGADFQAPYYVRGVSAYYLQKPKIAYEDLNHYLKINPNPQLTQIAKKILSDIYSKYSKNANNQAP